MGAPRFFARREGAGRQSFDDPAQALCCDDQGTSSQPHCSSSRRKRNPVTFARLGRGANGTGKPVATRQSPPGHHASLESGLRRRRRSADFGCRRAAVAGVRGRWRERGPGRGKAGCRRGTDWSHVHGRFGKGRRPWRHRYRSRWHAHWPRRTHRGEVVRREPGRFQRAPVGESCARL